MSEDNRRVIYWTVPRVVLIKDTVSRYTLDRMVYRIGPITLCYTTDDSYCCPCFGKQEGEWKEVTMMIEKEDDRLYLTLYRTDDKNTMFACISLLRVFKHIEIGEMCEDIPAALRRNSIDKYMHLIMQLPEDPLYEPTKHIILFKDEDTMVKWLTLMKSQVERTMTNVEYRSSGSLRSSTPKNSVLTDVINRLSTNTSIDAELVSLGLTQERSSKVHEVIEAPGQDSEDDLFDPFKGRPRL